MAGDGVGADAKPALFLMTGASKSLSISNTSTFYGLLCDKTGPISISSSSAVIKGTMLCGGAFSSTGGATIAYEPNVAAYAYDVVAPTTTASLSPSTTWSNTAVTVSLSAVDDPGGSGVASIKSDVDANPSPFGSSAKVTTGSSASVTVQTPGTHVVTFAATDVAGNTESAKSATVNIDTTLPTSWATHAPAANSDGWNSADTTITLFGSDAGGSTLKTVHYKIDSLSEQTCASGTSLAPFTSGKHTVAYWAEDVAGNLGAHGSETVWVDKQAPTVAPPTLAGSASTYGWYKAPVTVTITASDTGGSNVKTIYWTDTVAPTSGSVTGSSTQLQLSADGVHTLQCWSKDMAGNTSGISTITVQIDKIAPTITASRTAANADGWNNGPVTVSFSATDAGSSIATVTSDTTVSSEGAGQSVTGTAVDKAGNSATTSVSGINIDRTLPATTAAADRTPDSTDWYHGAVTYTLHPTDSLSGVKNTWYEVDPENDPQGTNAQQGTSAQVSGDGVHTLKFWSVDKAGNKEVDQSVTVRIDAVSPIITAGTPSGTQGRNGWWTSAVTVPFTATDTVSGFAGGTQLALSGTTSGDGSDRMASSGTATDLAGNTAPGITAGPFKVDTTVPLLVITASTTGWSDGPVTLTLAPTDSCSGIDPDSIVAHADDAAAAVSVSQSEPGRDAGHLGRHRQPDGQPTARPVRDRLCLRRHGRQLGDCAGHHSDRHTSADDRRAGRRPGSRRERVELRAGDGDHPGPGRRWR